MYVHHRSVEVVVQTPAKLNLFFEVLGRRTDGYHEIETLMCPIDLFDTLCFREESGGRIDFQCRWGSVASESSHSGLDEVPPGADNLVVRAVELLRRRAGVSRGARLRLVKRIPAAAGLGGGSSDAAAALVAANLGWRLGLARCELARLAAELGSDVPFFLAAGPALCRGRGECVQPVAGLGALSFVVVRPPEGLSTAAVYAACRPAEQPQSAGPLLEALRRGSRREAGRLLFNRLQPAAEGLSPRIAGLCRSFAAEDCLGHGMSGSGTACFGLFHHAAQARRVARRFRAMGLGTAVAVRSCC